MPEPARLYDDLPSRLAGLDRRTTRYRFDLEADIPWDRMEEPGWFLPPDFIGDLGFDPDVLRAHDTAWEMFQWAAAVQICEGIARTEEALLHAMGLMGDEVRSRRSNALLEEEERKHIAMFRRVGDHLRARRPMWTFRLDRHLETAFAGSMFDLLDLLDEPADWHYGFWAGTTLVEETLVYLYNRVAGAPGGQPTWVTAHRAHTQEESQHLRTVDAHLRAMDASLARRRAMGRVLHDAIRRRLDRSFGWFAGAFVAERFPDLPFVREAEITETAVYDHIVRSHPGFRHTRALLFPDGPPRRGRP